MHVKDAILERQSIRTYDPKVTIPLATLEQWIELATRAPSSWNLQPWRFVIITTEEGKNTLKPFVHNNMNQLVTSSALILILQDFQRYDAFPILNQMELEAGYVTPEQFQARQAKADQAKTTFTKEILEKTGLFDCGLVAQNLMLIAQEAGFDSCPMGGFDKVNALKALNIDIQRYQATLLLSIGKKADQLKKSLRLPWKSLVMYR